MAYHGKRPMVILFDIGGVCVVSPFQAILDYEATKGIPQGYINWAISQTGRTGAWSRLERGDLVCNAAFYSAWKADLTDPQRWREYHQKQKPNAQVPDVPDIDAEWLHNRMMTIARELDPHMGPALKRLRAHADASNGGIVIGALSNTSIFPPGHHLHDASTADGKASRGLEGIFDVFVSSAHIGMRKPDEEAYRYAIVRLREFVRTKGHGDGVEAGDIVFLDDIGQNLRTARKLGMGTIKVTLGKVQEAIRELEGVSGLDLTSDRARL